MKEIYTANQEIGDTKSYLALLDHSQRILDIALQAMKNPITSGLPDGDDEPEEPTEVAQ